MNNFIIIIIASVAFICSLSLWYSHESRIKNLFAFSSCCCCCRWFNTNQPWPKFSHCRVGFVCFHIYFFSSHNYTRRELKKRKFCNTYNVNFFFLFSIWIARLTTPLYECMTIVNFFLLLDRRFFRFVDDHRIEKKKKLKLWKMLGFHEKPMNEIDSITIFVLRIISPSSWFCWCWIFLFSFI